MAFKMKGSPMKRNFGVGASPTKQTEDTSPVKQVENSPFQMEDSPFLMEDSPFRMEMEAINGMENSPMKQKWVRNLKRKYLEWKHGRRTKKNTKRQEKASKERADVEEFKSLYGEEVINKKGKSKGYKFTEPGDEKKYKKELKEANKATKKANKSQKKLNKTTGKLNKLNKRSKEKGDFDKKVNVYN